MITLVSPVLNEPRTIWGFFFLSRISDSQKVEEPDKLDSWPSSDSLGLDFSKPLNAYRDDESGKIRGLDKKGRR